MIIELSDRKKQILDAIVSDYIDTAEPVGSFNITHNYVRQYSPATIRSEMAELEHIGYITHPHTSAGRIPTDLGYRYFVDYIMETKNVSGKEIALIKSGIRKIGRGFEEILHGTVKIIASVIDYIAVFVSFGKEKGKVFSSGYSNILKQPEFKDVSHAQKIMEAIEHEDFLARILEEYSRKRDLNIRIGHENRFRDMQDLSIAVVKHNVLGINPGAIGIIGPTRMDYTRVKSVLDYVSKELESLERETINVRGN
jgi:transcriptional regulator of heat shock response